MPFRTKSAHWFEAKIPRNQTVYALKVLADHGGIQLEDTGRDTAPCIDRSSVRKTMRRIDTLSTRHAEDLPKPAPPSEKVFRATEELADNALQQLQKWALSVNQVRADSLRKHKEADQLRLLLECLQAMDESSSEIGALNVKSNYLYKQLIACPREQPAEARPCTDVYVETYPGTQHNFLLLAGDISKEQLLESASTLCHCQAVHLPTWLPPTHADQVREVSNRIERLDRQCQELADQLQSLRNDTQIANVLSETHLLHWLMFECVNETPDHSHCRVNGWTFATHPNDLVQLLAESGIQSEVVFTQPQDFRRPPINFGADKWSQPFRWTVSLLGTPGDKEIDPTPAVTFIMPLVFGFMFPDIGHGLVLALAGIILGRTHPQARFLIPCGLAAAGFGLLFGEFFGPRDFLQAPFTNMMEHPVDILLATLVLGILLILLGLVFSGIEAWWRGEQLLWLLEEAPVILLYLSCILLFFWPHGWLISAAASAWFLAGSLVLCRKQGSRCILRHLGQLLESTYQLVTASLSFLRVGAFALMHMALTSMTLQLAEGLDNPIAKAVFLVSAHLLIVVVEGLIVMIQTTRLVVLEFFSRFLRFDGRVYQPLGLAANGNRTSTPDQQRNHPG